MKRTYGKLELSPCGKMWLMSGIPPHVAIRLKQLFPRLPKHAANNFPFPNNQLHCADLSWFCSRYTMEMTPEHAQALTGGRLQFENDQAELGRIMLADYQSPAYVGLKPDQVVRHYQAQAIEVLRRRYGLLLGDDLGLGKTYTAAGFMLMTEARPAVAVVQAHLQKQWAQKIGEFTNLRVHQIKGTKPYDLPPADVYVYRYTQIVGWVDVLTMPGKFNSVTYDEVQELRTGDKSQKGAAAKRLSDAMQYRLGLSATPIYGYGAEVWNIMQCIDASILGGWEDFIREWCIPTGSGYAVKEPEALGTYLREQSVFIRRTKKDVGQQVPPINRIVEIVETDQKAMDNIAELAHRLAVRTMTGAFMERGKAAMELDLLVRQATGIAKAKSVAAYVRILLEAGVPVMLMGWHREVYTIWMKELAEFKPVMFTGSETANQKQAAKDAFLSGETNLFIMSLRSGAGLDDLQRRCSTVVFGELDWSPKVHEQVIGRLDREGQTEQVTAIYLNSDEGSDPPMVDLLGIKASQSTGIVDPGRVFEAVAADTTRIKALAAQYLSKREVKEMAALPPPEAANDPVAEQPKQLSML